VGRNGNNIADLAQDLVCDISGASVQFVYNSSGTATWEVFAQIGGNGGTAVTLDGVQTLTNKTLTAPTIASANLTTALTLAGAAGTSGQVLTSAGSGLPTWSSVSAGYTLGTPVASTSGSAITFTGIPAGTKQIVISFAGVSTNGTSRYGIRLGDAGGIETTNYNGAGFSIVGATVAGLTNTSMFFINNVVASAQLHGSVTLTLENSTSFSWAASGLLSEETSNESVFMVSGTKSLSQQLDRVQVVIESTDTFDAGEINIAYI
jgi:hypothetical protein